MARVLGVDACRSGWVGITSDLRGYQGVTIDALVAAAESDGEVAVVGIDIPIGLPTTGRREADVSARRTVGERWRSVFLTPIRAALEAPTYAEANALARQVIGKGISRQAYGLRTKILEVDAWLRTAERTVIEVHPEVSFRCLKGKPLPHPKSTWAGIEERRGLLRDVGIELPADLGEAGARAAVDDVLDAAAVSWTADRYAAGRATSLPEVPEQYDDGPAAAIWV